MKHTIHKLGASLLFMVLFAALCMPVSAAEQPFSDVQPGAYYYDAVMEMSSNGVVLGVGNGKFAPAQSITHAEVLTMLCRMAGVDTTAYEQKGGPWYSGVEGWAKLAQILPTGTNMTHPVTREEIARYIVLVYQLERTDSYGNDFPDMLHDAAAQTLRDYGVVEGYEKDGVLVFGGKDNIKRCDACLMLSRLKAKAEAPDWSELTDDPMSAFSVVLRQRLQEYDKHTYDPEDLNWWRSLMFVSGDYGITKNSGIMNIKRMLEQLESDPSLSVFSWSTLYGTRTITLNVSYNITELAVRAITGQMEESWSDLEKLVFVNSYMTSRFEYDHTLENSQAKDFFQDGKGTCNAYTHAVMTVMERLNIPCTTVLSHSFEMDGKTVAHIWNAVELDGNWYQLDVTWNDPYPDSPGASRFDYFLLTEDAMKTVNDGEHLYADDWECARTDAVCTDTAYDDYFWRDVASPFLYLDGQWYCVGNDGLMTWDGRSNSTDILLSFPQQFRNWYPGYRFGGEYVYASGLFELDGALYFNTYYSVIRYDLASGKVTRLYDNVRNFNGWSVAGCWLNEDGTLGYQLMDANWNVETRSLPLS